MKNAFTGRKIMLITILYRTAAIIMMLTMIISQSLYLDFKIFDYTNILLISASVIVLFIYWHVESGKKTISYIVYIETLLLLIVYFITGGLHSPVIWLVTSPAVFYLFHYRGKVFIIIFSILFLITTFTGPYIIGDILFSESFLYFPCFIMSVIITFLLSMIAKQFRVNCNGLKKLEEYHRLLQAAKEKNDNINIWLNNSYSFIENLLSSENMEECIKRIFNYIAMVVPAFGFYLYIDNTIEHKLHYSSIDVKQLLEDDSSDHTCVEYDVEGAIHYATLGIVLINDPQETLSSHNNKIELVLKITALYLESQVLMKENKALSIANEQKRIAEEMHDGLNQDIHGTTYMLYDILTNYKNYEVEHIIEKIQLTYETMNEAAQSLRKIIFRLNSTSNVYNWQEGVNGLAVRLSKQYFVSINVMFDDSLKEITYVSPALFDSFRRIIKEAISNAIKHGGASRIDLLFLVDKDQLKLRVHDNGAGFMENLDLSSGLGIKNMKKLTQMHRGSFKIVHEVDIGGCVEMGFKYGT